MHVLVTGGGGFLGRYIVEQFVARGEQVRTFSRRAYRELEELGVEQIRGDLKNSVQVRKACASVDCVVHAAAQPGIAMRPNGYYAANLEGTQHVIDACLAEQVERLVYTSSPSVTFAGRDQCGVDESEPLALEWLQTHRAYYSHSKALAERLVLTVDQNRLRTCALRPHLIWGPRDGHLIPRLIQRARQGRLRRVGAGTNRVDVIYVENAAAAHLAACDALGGAAAAAGKAYFLSQGEPVNCWQWIDEILALVDLPPVRRAISLAAARRIGSVLETLYRTLRLRGEPPMTRFLASQLARSHWFDISAARRDLGYAPLVSTEEGMRRLGKWLEGDEPG